MFDAVDDDFVAFHVEQNPVVAHPQAPGWIEILQSLDVAVEPGGETTDLFHEAGSLLR